MSEAREGISIEQTIYIDQSEACLDGPIAIFARNAAVVYTGLKIQAERGTPLLSEISRLCGLDFFQSGSEPAVPLYGVPCVTAFASDGTGGWFVCGGDWADGAIYHITPGLSAHFTANRFSALLEEALRDPDWRQKRLADGPWPQLPEDRAGREKLAKALRLPHPAPENPQKAEPPRIFSSRAEAEKAFSILDVWTVLRQKKTPRFQVYPMMSPEDREGRALVHYTAWQETYPGLMPEGVLAAHTLEKCRNIAAASRHNTLVLLDREDGDRVVGFACYGRKAREFVSVPGASEITALYVLREFQGLGLGRMLMEGCLACLPHGKTVLFVLKGNESAIGFYEHMGFHPTGHTIIQHLEQGTLAELELCLDRCILESRKT